jgi:hypothetical protein
VRPKDVVGVGSGRGPYYTADACTIPPTSAFYPEEVVALTGKMTAHYWGKRVLRADKVRSLDADFVASLLVTGLGVNRPPRLVNRPITGGSAIDPDGVTIALIGIGALAGGHRLRQFGASDELKPVAGDLGRLKHFAEKADPHGGRSGQFPHWIGDVCNFLFVIDDPLGPDRLEVGLRNELTELVVSLNSRFVNTRPESLTEICRNGAVIAVAGGPHKVTAIAHVLRQKQPWITHLVTDDVTARHLLEADTLGRSDIDKGGGI